MRLATAAIALVALLVVAPAALASTWATVSSDQISEPDIVVLESNGSRTVIQYELTGYLIHDLQIEGDDHIVLSIPGHSLLMERGMPDLPSIRQSIIVPDDGRFTYRITDVEYETVSTTPVAPSKGHFTRDIDPASVPYTFGRIYGSDALYPTESVVLHEPYILRDYRGMVVEVNPIRYNPARHELEIARRLVVEITKSAPGGANVKERPTSLQSVASDFDFIYREHFINYENILDYTPIPEPGNLMIITYDAFRPDVEPLYQWKLEQGIPVEIRNLSEVGATWSQIKTFIDACYFSPEGVTYIILVGDRQQIPTMTGTAEGASSDPCYAKCEGGDHYPDLFISRISAQNATQVQTQVAKIVNYEKYPDTGAAASWYAMGTGIASNEGSPPDYTRCNWLRDMLMGYNYVHVDQIYDPGASASSVTVAVNQGRSALNYIGHGSGTSWSTTGFSNSHVHQLANVGKLPWIIDVSCMNGDFGMSECFAEAWLRAGSAAAPTGGVAHYAASTNASWVPPCDMQYHAVELMTTEQRKTVGGLFFNGVMHGMDVHPGYEATKMVEQYNIFGDCSMMVRNTDPTALDMQHLGVLLVGLSTYDVTVTGDGTPVAGALVCARTEGPGGLYATGYTDATGMVTLDFGGAVSTVGTLELTATAYNGVPDFDTATIVPPNGPYCVYDHHVVDDDMSGTSQGNGDGLVDAGERIELMVALLNVGNETAYGVTATLSENSEYVTLEDDYEEFGDVPAGGTMDSLDDFDVVFSGDTPDGHAVVFTIEATDGIDSWSSVFTITVGAPVLGIHEVVLDDPPNGGNGNGCIEPGETVTLALSLENSGSRNASNVVATLSTSDEYVVVEQNQGTVALVDAGGTAMLAPPFVVRLTPDAPPYHQPLMQVHCTGDGGLNIIEMFSFTIGSTELEDQFESGEGLWTHAPISAGAADDWHLETYRANSPTHSWKYGGAGSAPYSDGSDGGLVSAMVCLGSGGQLDFHDWLDAEQYNSTYAWDGCVVEISTDEGASWEIIAPVGGYSHQVYSSSSVPLPSGTPLWSGAHAWRGESFDLTDYENELVMFRFRFVSDGYVGEEGWYIDDVVVSSSTTGAQELALSPLPYDYTLGQNAPNPFNPVTTIEYALPRDGQVSLRIYNVGGRLVKTLVEGFQAAGYGSATWDGTNEHGQKVASGVYLYHLQAGDFSAKRTMVLLK